MATGLERVYEVINKENESGIQIQHTLENLALIQSAQALGRVGLVAS